MKGLAAAVAAWPVSENIMSFSISSNKVTTLELDIHDLRALITEKSQAILGEAEQGFERKVDIEPLLVVAQGKATLTGVKIVVTDTLRNDDPDRLRAGPAASPGQ